VLDIEGIVLTESARF